MDAKYTNLKWLGTALCLIGIGLTSLNVYPLNLIFGFTGSLAWTLVGIYQKDAPLFIVEAVAVAMYLGGMIKVMQI
jgi:hypothetical protein